MPLVKDMNEATPLLHRFKEEKEEQKRNEQVFLQEEKRLSIERDQVNIRSPAIARLHLRYSTPLDIPAHLKEAKRRWRLMENTSDQFPVTLNSWQEKEDHYIPEARSSKTMYTWMENFIDSITKEAKQKGFNVRTKGAWSLY